MNKGKYRFLVTTTATIQIDGHFHSNNDVVAVSIRYENEDDIDKSLEHVAKICSDLNISGNLLISFDIEKDDEYFDRDEDLFYLSEKGEITFIG